MRSCIIISVVALFGGLSPIIHHEVSPELAFAPILVAAVLFPPVMFIVMTCKMHGHGFGVAVPLIAVLPMVVVSLAMTGFFYEPWVYFLPLVQSLAFS